MNAAREKVRVAHALKDLPGISERFRKGELSYSKVRAMTRVADAANEDYLLMIAQHGTAHHVEKLVSQFRRCKRLQDTENANKQQATRSLHCHFDDDGSMVIRGRIPAEQGALIVKALELAMDRAGTSSKARLEQNAADVTAVTSISREPFHASRADALAEMAETYLNGEPGSAASADRYLVMVHVTPAALQEEAMVEVPPAHVTAVTSDPDVTAVTPKTLTAEMSFLEDGPHLAAETARRISCDGSILKLVEDEQGQPLAIGRKSRTIPPALRRALRVRDRGCRFPGCTHTAYIDGHHVQHWADGGETSLENLVMLCRRHHRMVHEGGYGCERQANGDFVFTDPYQRLLPASPTPVRIDTNPEFGSYIESWLHDLDIDERTCVPHWYAGDRMDWDLAVWHMFQIEEKGQRQVN
jgi:hypothetical protein